MYIIIIPILYIIPLYNNNYYYYKVHSRNNSIKSIRLILIATNDILYKTNNIGNVNNHYYESILIMMDI